LIVAVILSTVMVYVVWQAAEFLHNKEDNDSRGASGAELGLESLYTLGFLTRESVNGYSVYRVNTETTVVVPEEPGEPQ
ncbi:MAG: hypothetical protein ACP5HZ_07715, partial [Ferrimicrobium sp.]